MTLANSLLLLLVLAAPLGAQSNTLLKKLAELETRHAALKADDVEGRRALALWCAGQKLRQSERRIYREMVAMAPQDKSARAALGHVTDGTRWFDSDDALQIAAGNTRRLTKWESLTEEQKAGMKLVHDCWLTPDEFVKVEAGEALLGHARKSEHEVLTREYRITSALATEKTLELARLIEQAIGQWREASKAPYAAPNAKTLCINILKDNAAFIAMVKNDIESFDQELIKAQGFFDGQTCWISYFHNWHTTIRVLLHEARHQYDGEITATAGNMPGWYMEGTAEFYSMHTWDGKKLAMGQLIPDQNYSLFFCKKLLGQGKITGARETLENPWPTSIDPAFYQNSWALIYFLKNASYADGFAKWEVDLLAGKFASTKDQLDAFQEQVALDLVKFDKDYKSQLKEWGKLSPKEWK